MGFGIGSDIGMEAKDRIDFQFSVEVVFEVEAEAGFQFERFEEIGLHIWLRYLPWFVQVCQDLPTWALSGLLLLWFARLCLYAEADVAFVLSAALQRVIQLIL
jgi:hypothetical protein